MPESLTDEMTRCIYCGLNMPTYGSATRSEFRAHEDSCAKLAAERETRPPANPDAWPIKWLTKKEFDDIWPMEREDD